MIILVGNRNIVERHMELMEFIFFHLNCFVCLKKLYFGKLVAYQSNVVYVEGNELIIGVI